MEESREVWVFGGEEEGFVGWRLRVVDEERLVVEEDHEEGRVGSDPFAEHAPRRPRGGEGEFDAARGEPELPNDLHQLEDYETRRLQVSIHSSVVCRSIEIRKLTILLVIRRQPFSSNSSSTDDSRLTVQQLLWLISNAAPKQASKRSMNL